MKIKYLKILMLLFVFFSCSKDKDIIDDFEFNNIIEEVENVDNRWQRPIIFEYQFFVTVNYTPNLHNILVEKLRNKYFKSCDEPLNGYYDCENVDFYASFVYQYSDRVADEWVITICSDRILLPQALGCLTNGIKGQIADEDDVDEVE